MLFSEMTWPALKSLPRNIPIVIPIAAIEQHGHHLPVATDTLLLTEIIRRVDANIGDLSSMDMVGMMFPRNKHCLNYGKITEHEVIYCLR